MISPPRARLAVRFTLMLGLAALLVAPAAADTKLRWKFAKGEKLYYDMIVDMSQEMAIGDQNITMKMAQKMNMTWEVDSVADDGTASLKQTIDRIRMSMAIPGAPAGQGGIEFDSKAENKGEAAAILGPLMDGMVGKPFILEISPRGEIKNVKIPEATLEAIKKSPLQQMGGMFSEAGIKEMMGRAMFSFPEEAVKNGSTWKSTMEMANPVFGKQVTEMLYEYAGQESRAGGDQEKIDVSMRMKFEKGANAQADVEVKDQASAGVLYFDNAKGVLTDSDVTGKMTLAISIGGMSIEQAVTTHVTMKQTDGKQAEDDKKPEDVKPANKSPSDSK